LEPQDTPSQRCCHDCRQITAVTPGSAGPQPESFNGKPKATAFRAIANATRTRVPGLPLNGFVQGPQTLTAYRAKAPWRKLNRRTCLSELRHFEHPLLQIWEQKETKVTKQSPSFSSFPSVRKRAKSTSGLPVL